MIVDKVGKLENLIVHILGAEVTDEKFEYIVKKMVPQALEYMEQYEE